MVLGVVVKLDSGAGGGGWCLIFDIENDIWTNRNPLNWVKLGHYS